MDERASFEARAVLPPRRARRTRLAILIPAVAFIAIAWAGLSGNRADEATAGASPATPVGAAPIVSEATYPPQVVGIDVLRLGDLPRGLSREEVIAVVGWYVPTSITDCPPLAILYRQGALPEVRRDVDSWAYCHRSGVLYASRPDPDPRTNATLDAVAVSVVIGVVVPPELETVGADATQVVVLGRFRPSGENCDVSPGCGAELEVDHVAWTPGA